MSAQQAAKEYGLTKKGNKVIMKNSCGTRIEVDKNAKVYHRGNKNFAVYSNARDKKRQAKGINQLSPRSKSYKVGQGPYRHTKDGKR
jgi:hypothetical protein